MEDKVLEAMKAKGEPVSAGTVAEITGIDRKDVDKIMKKLKDEGKIVSHRRCFWQPA